MKKKDKFDIGIMYRRENQPEALPDFARHAEEAGFDELWVVEDCFFGSGVASAAVALACTKSIKVGLGIMPAVVRNSVFTAMEIATLACIYPNRFHPGLGHGVGSWMKQIGAFPKSQLKALEEVTAAVRALIAGKEYSFDGEYVKLKGTKLVHSPEQIPPVSLGVIGPKSLELSGRVADGTILSEYSAPTYVSWAKEKIDEGQQKSGRDRDHRITVFNFACGGKSTEEARRELRPMVVEAMSFGSGNKPKFAAMGILDQVNEYKKTLDKKQLKITVSDEWIDQLTVAGTPEDWEASITQLVDAGANSVVLVPLPNKGVDELDSFTRHLRAL